jgi:hypothetical protein
MREMLAVRSGRDVTMRGPARGRRAAPMALRLAGAAVTPLVRRPVTTLTIAGALAAASWVILNAVALQTSRHPAPMFGGKPRQEVVAKAPPAVAASPAKPVEAVRPPEPPRAQPAKPPAPPPPTTSKSRDPIGEIIRGEPGTTSAARSDGPKRITAAQTALLKLGYGPLKIDGVTGPGTKAAIERFERDRKLPVTGELGPRTARELAREAGIALE